MRVLLVTNIIYALVIPVIDIFVGAYIMRSSGEPGLVAIYQLAAYTGIPLTFLINGFLLNKIKIAHLHLFNLSTVPFIRYITKHLQSINLPIPNQRLPAYPRIFNNPPVN